jgi:DNA repair protein RecN (Recombination protein N)
MLKTLHIKNYALIEEITAELSGGLIILTGETGAGKSILIDALGLVIGNRASADAVRSGADRAVVEAVFGTSGNKKLRSLFEENDIEPTDEVIVRREVSAKGQSRCFLNDSPITIGLLKQVGELLVDLHGQHEHQSLLRTDTHVQMLDDFGGLEGMVTEFQTALKDLREQAGELETLRRREQQLRERREFLAFQLQEIDAVGPQAGEDEALEQQLTILENAERLYESTTRLYELLYEGDHSVRDQLVVARNQLHDLADIDKQFAEAAGECSTAEAVVAELAKFIHSDPARIEFNPARLDELRQRLGRLSMLRKKYGGSIEAVITYRTSIAEEVRLAENFDGVIGALAGKVEEARERCAVLAQRISTKRHEVARKVDRAVVEELRKLGIQHGKFSTRISRQPLDGADGGEAYIVQGKERVALNSRGSDLVEFYLSTNLGEEEKPLVKVASGGEVSRVMLALKSILAKSDRLPVLIFDEIDVGVSGRIAQAVGLSLKALSGFHQVVVITHLPQIAGLADAHFVVEKAEHRGRTSSALRRLTLEEQVHEVAKLMSGADVTEAGLTGAKELMGLR